MSRWNKFWVLPVSEKKIFMAALFGLPIIHLRLRLWGFKNYIARMQGIPLTTSHPKIHPLNCHAPTSYLANTAARLLFEPGDCWERSIMLCTLLRRNGLESKVKIGVAKANKEFYAHASVEIDGTAINVPPHSNQRFTTFDSSFTPEYRDFA